MKELLSDAGNVGIIVIAVGFLLQTIIPFLKGKPVNGEARMRQQIDELHRWHSPNSAGVQSWKNSELTSAIERLTEAVDDLKDSIDDLKSRSMT